VRTIHASLQEAEDTIGQTDARALIANFLGVDRAWLVANPMHVLTETQDATIDAMVAQRVLGQPVAYLLGKREFYSREFDVGPAVLIPRPETETLVEAVLARTAPGASIVDLGTGSGAIAVTLACERPLTRITATDLSAGALEVARANAQRLCPGRIEFVAGSWYAPLDGRRFDAIVANPPYIRAGDPHLGKGDLRFEPRAALTDESTDGLASLRAIVEGAGAHLNSGGWLLLEQGYDQADACRALLASAGFDDLVSIPDLAGIPRVAGGRFAS
jgi:release factor glutamine methyltransferase